MSSDVKLLAVDLDGTMLTSKGKLTDANAAALRKAVEKGIEVVPISGRPPFGIAHPLSPVRDCYHLVIAHNGSYVLDLRSGEVIFDRPISMDQARDMVELGHQLDLYVGYYVGDDWYVERDCEGMRTEQFYMKGTPKFVNNLLTDVPLRPNKVIVVEPHDTALLGRFYESARTARPELHINYTSQLSVEISNRDGSKGDALKLLAERMRIDMNQVMAVGDNYNDLTMLEYAGIAVAMGNAPDEVKAKADLIVGTNLEDGFAQAVEKVIFNGWIAPQRRGR